MLLNSCIFLIVLTIVSGSSRAYRDTGEFIQTYTICEGNMIHLECPVGKMINVISGTYGRSDVFTCLMPRIGCLNCVTTCSINATMQFSTLFNEQRYVLTQLSNSLMGIDPCYGTYKYATVSYVCVTPNESNVEDIILDLTIELNK